MKINVELGNQEIRDMLMEKLRNLMPEVEFNEKDVKIVVRSKQNYRSHEWEDGEVKASYEREEQQ